MSSPVTQQELRSFLAGTTLTNSIDEMVQQTSGAEAAGGNSSLTRSTLEKLERGITLAPAERYHLEAVIIPDKRPAIDIVNGDFQTRHPDWLHLNTLDIKARLKGAFASIGRIELPQHPRSPYGGTGFVVGDGLIMTNRHVAELFAEGIGIRHLRFKPGVPAGIDFLKERRSTAEAFLRVTGVVMIHPHWDMALLRVEGLPPSRVPLALSTLADRFDKGRDVAVIGYPTFDERNPADVQNDVFAGVYGVKRLQPGKVRGRGQVESYRHMVEALLHDSSTLGGNSGSAALCLATGEVVGVHFGGRYGIANYCVPSIELARDARIIDAGVRFAGRTFPGPTPWDAAWRNGGDGSPAAEDAASPPPNNSSNGIAAQSGGSIMAGKDGETLITIPLEITVRLGKASLGAQADAATPQTSDPSTDATVEKAVPPVHDTDYANRTGYDPTFLGISVPLPKPRRPQDLVRLENGEHFIPYHHFSLAMHRKRRLAVLAAANVSAEPARKRPGNRPPEDYTRKALGGLGKSDSEKWFSDERILETDQLPDKFYNKDRQSFDKGHIVRREDVAWGDTYKEMQNANGDTFHVTNCSPQTAMFNRSGEGEDNWGDLENLVLKQAKAERLCVFGGPVLADDDPIFSGVDTEDKVAVKIPRKFWKLIVAANAGQLQAFGFVLEQDLSSVDMEFTVPTSWLRYMVPVVEIERLAKLDFARQIRNADQSSTNEGVGLRSAAGIAAAQPVTESPTVAATNVDVADILEFWRSLQGAAKSKTDRIRFVIELARPVDDGTIADVLGRALDLRVEVGPLFDPDLDLDGFRVIDLPGLVPDDRSDLFDVARFIYNLLPARSVEPDLSANYYDGGGRAAEGSAESSDFAFWCWVDESNRPADPEWALTKTRVREAWAFSTAQGKPSAGKGSLIFQLDTGIVPTHAEMTPNAHKDRRAANFVEATRLPIDPMTGSGNLGHGTGTFSVAASPVGGRMSGSSPAATLVPIRCITSVAVLDQSRVAQAIDHARRNGAHVITMSLGGVPSAALHAAVRKAVDANIIVVAAAGNCVGTVVWPARYDEVIAVGGINEKLLPWKGSCRGDAIDISGPAELVSRADPRDPTDKDKVGPGQGTSFATAHLAGVAACWLAHFGRDELLRKLPSGSRMQSLFKAMIQRTAQVPAGFDHDQFGAGIVDANALLRREPELAGAPEAVARGSTADQVRDLLAEVGAFAQAEAATASLSDEQSLLELACMGLDRARSARVRAATLEATPPVRMSRGLRVAGGAGFVRSADKGGLA